jgi:hypothetical protein
MVNVGPGGVILGVQGGGANMSTCAGIATPRGAIPGMEVGGGAVARACTGTAGVELMVGGGRVCSGSGVGFRTPPQSLSSSVWVIVNIMVLALDNADTPCCESTVLGRTRAFRLGDAHLLSGLRP